MQPRNTLVTVAPIKNEEKKVGNIVVPQQTGQQYQQAEVIAVGPGMVASDNERSQCADLKPGQVVLVQVASRRPGPAGGSTLESIGLDYKTDDGRDLVLVEQSQIVGILQQPGEDIRQARDSVAGKIGD